jgi:hypothetical protein
VAGDERNVRARRACRSDQGLGLRKTRWIGPLGVAYPPPPLFSQVFILKELKVVCFHTLLQVLILKVVSLDAKMYSFDVEKMG